MSLRCFVMMACVLALGVTRAGASERIDDMTVREGDVFIQRHLAQPDTAPPTLPNDQRRGMNDGFVFCSASENVYPFDLATHVPGAGVGGYDYPYDAMMNPQGTQVWVADASEEAAIVLDRATNTVTHTIPIGGYTTGIAFSGDGSFALAADRDSDIIAKISTLTYVVVDSIADVTGESMGPGFITYCPGNDCFYAPKWYGNRLFEISSDGTEVLREITLGSSLWQLVCSHDGTMLYVLDRGTDMVRFIDVASFSQVAAVPVGDDPWGIDITPDDSLLVIGCEDSHELYVCSTVAQTAVAISLSVNDDPRDVDISEDGAFAYIPTGPDLDRVLIFDIASMTVIGSIAPSGAGTTNSLSVAPQMGPWSLPLELTGELIGGSLQLTWSAAAEADAYWVFGAANRPWFVPGFAPGYEFRVAVLPPATTTWSSAEGIGDSDANWTYLVMAVDGVEDEMARSNRFGEHDFEANLP